jgi:hypothetical protein
MADQSAYGPAQVRLFEATRLHDDSDFYIQLAQPPHHTGDLLGLIWINAKATFARQGFAPEL